MLRKRLQTTLLRKNHVQQNKNMFLPLKKNLQSSCEKNIHNYNQTVLNETINKYILKKNRPNNRLIKKRKIRQFAQKILKDGPVETQLALSSSPD